MEPLGVLAFSANPGWVAVLGRVLSELTLAATASVLGGMATGPCLAFLPAMLAVTLRYGQGTSLRGYLEARSGKEEPAWRLALEPGLRRDAGAPRREQNPLRSAVTPPTAQPAAAERTRVARQTADAAKGQRP